MSSTSQIVLITGANQGLGFSIAKVAGDREPQNTYILCSRNLESGQQAVQEIQAFGITAKIDLLQVDVTNDEQIAAAAQYVESTYGRLDGK